jgi:hypothetical protein
MGYKYDTMQSEHSSYSAKLCLTNKLEISESALLYFTEYAKKKSLLYFMFRSKNIVTFRHKNV